MKLEIVAFQEYYDFTIKLSNQGVILLQGDSGSGKSTILRAIRWCLYGGSAHGEEYEVSLHYKSWRVNRKSKPMRLEVKDKSDGSLHNGDIAVQVIARIFGPAELFDLCCNYKQITARCPLPLFDSSNKQRLSYLSRFAFQGQDDPTELIEKISAMMKEKMEVFEKRKWIYRKERERLLELEDRYNLADIVFDWSIKKKEEEFKARHSLYLEQLERLEVKYLEAERNKALIGQLLAQRRDLKKKIRQKTEQLQMLENDDRRTEKERLYRELKILEGCERKILKAKLLIFLPLDSEDIPRFTERDYYEAERVAREHEENENICRRLGISYSNDDIDDYQRRLRAYLQYQDQKKKYKAYQAALKQYQKLARERPHLKEEITKLDQMKRSLQVLECPHCQQLVYLAHDKKHVLIKADTAKRCSKKEIKEQEELVNELETREKELEVLAAGRDHLFRHDPSLEELQLSNTETESIIKQLGKIKVIEKPRFSLSQIRLMMRYVELGDGASIGDADDASTVDGAEGYMTLSLREIREQRLAINQKLKQLPENPEIENVKCQSVLDSLNEQLGKVTSSLISERRGLSDIDYKEEKLVLQKRITNLATKLEQVRQAHEVESRRHIVEQKRQRLHSARADYKALRSLYRNALTEHRIQLQRVVDQINGCIIKVIPKLFSYPISIGIRLSTKAETGKHKYSVSFNIIRKGKDRSARNPDEVLSGGEVQRVVLLVIIALNQLYKSPFILFDELFSSLDPRLREKALEVVKMYLSDRLVFCAEHFAEAGDYDQCIEVSME